MLGRALVREARGRGWAALALSHAQADVTDASAALHWARAFQPEVVFNCAAATAVDACEERREEAFAVNGEAVAGLAAATAAVGARLVQVSTDYVFDGASRSCSSASSSPRRLLAPYTESGPAGASSG